MALEDRVLELEKDFAGIDHGRFERIEKQNEQIFIKINDLADSTSRMDERMEDVENACSGNTVDIKNMKEAEARKQGGMDMLKWIIPVSIAITGLLTGLLTWGLDKLIH